MSLAEIYATFRQQMGPGGSNPITLDDTSLGSTGVDALLQQTLGLSAITVSVTSMAPPTTQLIVQGTSSFLVGPTQNGLTNAASLSVTVAIVDNAGAIGLNVVVNLPPAWTLGQGFFPWLGSIYDSTALLSQPQLVFTNYAQSYPGPPALALVPGLNLAASMALSVTGPLGLVTLLFADSPGQVTLQGPVTFTPAGPVFVLEADLPDVKAPFGPVAVTDCRLRLGLAWVVSGYTDVAFLPFTASQFVGHTAVVSGHAPTEVVCDLIPGTATLMLNFLGDPAKGIISTSDLSALLAGYPGFAGTVPWDLLGTPPIGLTDFGLVIQPKLLTSGKFPVVNLWATVSTLAPWTIIPGVDQFIIDRLAVRWTTVGMPGANFSGNFVTAGAELTIDTYTFDVEVTFPDLQVAAQLPGGVSLNLSDISKSFFASQIPANPDLSSSSVAFFDFSIFLAPKQKTFAVSTSATANLAFAGVDIELSQAWLSLSANFAASPVAYQFLASGVLTIQQWPFLVSATIANAGMQFAGTLTEPRTLAISDVLGSLLAGVGVPPPGLDLSATVEQFGVALDTGASTYQVQGDVKWHLGLAGKSFDPETRFFVRSATPPGGGARVWSGYLAAALELGGLTFTAAYQFGPQMSRLAATASSGTYDPNAFGQSFGAGIPALPPAKLPSFGLTEITLFYDFAAEDLVLTGTVPTSGGSLSGFLELRAGGGSTGFTFGLGIQDSGTFFTDISSVLAPIDALGLTGLTIVLSNLPPGTAYTVPLPRFNGYQGVYPGINVYATFAWDQTSNAGLQFARTALSPSTTTLAVLAAFYEWSGTATFVLAGRLQNLALDFTTWNLAINWAEMRLSLTVSDTGEAIAIMFALQMTYTASSGSYLPPPTPSDPNPAPQPPQLQLNGMLSFVENDGNFGAFMGASMVGTWADALGFTGLDISNLGVVVGIDGEGIPSFGLTGLVTYQAFLGWIAIYFDSVNPANSMFGGAFSDVLLGELLQFCLPGVNVPSSLLDALDEFGITHTTPAPISGLTAADWQALDAGTVSATLAKILADHGDPLAPQAGSQRTVIVSSFTDPVSGHPAWYIANTPNMATVTVIADGPIATATTGTVSWNVQIYCAPTTITPFPGLTFEAGYRFDGTLRILGWTLEVQASVNPSKGVYLGAYASPILLPSDGSLLAITAADDRTQGPWLSLSTYDYVDPRFPYSSGPHFGLSAEIDLLSFARSKLQIMVLSSGLSFDYAVSLGDPHGSYLAATFDCLYGNGQLAASADFVAQLYLSLPALSIGGVEIIPAISAKIFSVSASLGLSIADACTVAAQVTLDVFGMGFSVGFSFDLPGMGSLISSLASGIVSNLKQLFAPLWQDALAWARAMASGLLDSLEDLGKTLQYFFQGDFAGAAAMLAQLGKDVEAIGALIGQVWNLGPTIVLNVLTKVFQLEFRYFGVGHGLGPAAPLSPPVAGLVEWMQGTASPAFAAADYGALLAPGAGAMGVYDARIVQIVRVSAALSDPGLYAMEIALDVDDTTLLSVSLGYQKLADGQGVFSAALAPPAAWRSRSFGPFGFQIPAIEVDVYTSGDWVIDVGFPFNGDWSGAAKLQMPFFSGQGGFYLGRPPAGSIAPFGDQQVTAVLGMGVAARMWIGGSIDFGILSGGISVTFTGIVQGYVGFGTGIASSQGDKSMFGKPAAIVLQGVFNLTGLLYGSVDFGIVSASVHVAISASLLLAVKNGVPTDFRFDVHVSVSVDVRIHLLICTITISFSFDAHFSYGPVIDWGGSDVVSLPAPAVGRWAPLPVQHLGKLGLAAKSPLTLFFAPEVTLLFGATGPGTAAGVANLAIGYTPGQADAPFNQLVQALLVWATQQDGGPPPSAGAITRAQLAYLLGVLAVTGTSARAPAGADPSSVLDYPQLVGFLSAAFAPTVAPAPNDPGAPTAAVYFPMIPDLTLWAVGQGGTSKPVELADFSAVNKRDAAYVTAVMNDLAAMRVMGGGGGTFVPPAQPVSMATLVFEEYFALLLKGGARALADAMDAAGATSFTAAQLAAFDFQQLAGSVATGFRGGAQLRFDTADPTPTPLMALTGQQFAIAATGKSYALSVGAGAGGGWLTIGPGQVALDLTQLGQYLALTVDAPLAGGVQAAPALAARPATFAFPSAGWQTWPQPAGSPWSLAALPATLDAAAGAGGIAVALSAVQPTRTGLAAAPISTGFAWATALALVVQRVPDPGSASGYAPGVYQIVATDPRQFAAIDGLTTWLEQVSGATATPSLLYVDPATGALTTPAAAASSIVVLRTNTTTESRPPTLLAAARAATPLPLAATLTAADAVGLMAIVKEYGIVNAPGYYLAVPPSGDQPGLPDALFAAGPTAALTIVLARGPAPSAANSTVLASDTSLLLLGAPPAGAQLAAVAVSAQVYQATQQPGTLAVTAGRANPGTGTLQAALDTLYGLFTAQLVDEGGYTASPFASPAGPQRPAGSDPATAPWTYLLAVPAARYLPAAAANPYAVAGTSPTLAFQIRDAFGNVDTPATTARSFPILYTDPLTGVSGWRGTELGWTVGGAWSLQITLAAQADQLSNLQPSDLANLITLWQGIAWQAADPNVGFAVATSLDAAGSAPVGGAAAPYAPGSPTLAGFAQAVLANLTAQAAGTPPPPLPAPVVIAYAIGSVQSATPPYAIDVSLRMARTKFVDASAAALLPAIAAVDSAVPVVLPAGGVAGLAAAFEAALPSLKLATGASRYQRGELWAVDRALVTLTIGSAPSYFAPAPLYDTLQSGTVMVPVWDWSGAAPFAPTTLPYTYSDVDIDGAARPMLAAIDALLAGPFAAAAYAVSPADYDSLVALRGQLAQGYGAHQVQWLFDQQVPPAPAPPVDRALWAARASLSDELRASLANAYAIDAVVQYPVTCAAPASAATAGLALSGAVQSRPGAATSFPTTAVKLRLPSIAAYLGEGLLSINYRPTATPGTRTIDYPLQYQITNVAFGDDPDDPLAEPSWLLLPVPVVVPIGATPATTVPIVVRQFPTPPALVVQDYTPYTPSGPPGFLDQLSWDYRYRVLVSPDAADTITTAIRFNTAVGGPRLFAADAALTLADATVRFQQGYRSLAPALPAVIEAASSTDPTVRAKAQAVLDGLVELIGAVVGNSTWAGGPTRMAAAVPARVDTYTLAFSETTTPGQWQLVVAVAPDGHGDLAAIVPRPLTLDGAPQPGTSAPVYTSTSVTVTYQPADPAAPLLAELALDGLSVLTLQSAWSSVRLARNADLMKGFTTAAAFVYQTPETSFPDQVTPLLYGPAAGYDIAQLTGLAAGSLDQYLAALFALLFEPGGQAPNPTPVVAATVGYGRTAFTGAGAANQVATARTIYPCAMSAATTLACLQPPSSGQVALPDFASALAGAFTTWTAGHPVDTTTGQLVLSLTLYANADGAATALAMLPNLVLPLGHLT